MPPAAAQPACPDCGYDLSGVAASWADACPLSGTCSECGAALIWSDVMNAPDRTLPWFVEHPAPGRRPGLFLRSWATWALTLIPWAFWWRVSFSGQRSLWRLFLWLPLLLVPLHIAKAITANLARALVHSTQGSSVWYWLAWASDDWTQPFILYYYDASPRMKVLNSQWQWPAWPPPVFGLIVASALAPLLLLLVGWLGGHGPRFRVETVRAGVYGLAWIPGLWLLALADSVGRLGFCVAGSLGSTRINGLDVEWLFEPVFENWRWWGAAAGAWWVAWWWSAITIGQRDRLGPAAAVSIIGGTLVIAMLVLELAARNW